MRDLDVSQLIQITAAGVVTASFAEIRNAVITRYKAAYGSDIDLSTGSADGIFVNDLCLIINNILQSVKTLYSNLDVNSASGVYLDALCRLSNVKRKQPTASSAELELTNISSAVITLDSGTEFIDKSGLTWIYTGSPIDIGLAADVSITVYCSEQGQISAEVGWIYSTVEALGLQVVQTKKAQLGTTIESDSKLRARRSQSSGANGITVLESLSGALLELAGIKDVLIYNNNSELSKNVPSDSSYDCTMLPHSIYVILRQAKNIDILDSVIGDLIYEKLTPGIRTSYPISTDANIRYTYEYTPSLTSGTAISLNQTVYWKRASLLSPKITIKLKTKEFFIESELESVVKDIVVYLNELKLNQAIDIDELTSVLLAADPMFKNNRTYIVSEIAVAEHVNNNDCYEYDVESYAKVSQTASEIIFSIGG